MAPAAEFPVPSSSSVVDVRIIDTTTKILGQLNLITPVIKGNEWVEMPSYAFLVEHSSGRKLLFDLGNRTDWEKLPPMIVGYIRDHEWKINVEQGVADQLEEHGVSRKSIEAIIWSHWHWDHTGDPTTFDPSTVLIVGPGFKEKFVPGYPVNEQCPVLDSDYTGRKLRELSFTADNSVKIGRFDAIDYFGDGSFYVLDAPGHTVGHLCGLARVTASPPSFILMGADCCHHSGEMRPSKYLPLPNSIAPNPLEPASASACPGALFEHLLQEGDRTKPFYAQKQPGAFFCEPEIAEQTIEKVQEADATGTVLVVVAHDKHLKGVVDFFPKYANDFVAKGHVEKARWVFLKDFKEALE
jgi:glyoxylase-like metal-dependent hydrolase (beta-lactamase superfamily II)